MKRKRRQEQEQERERELARFIRDSEDAERAEAEGYESIEEMLEADEIARDIAAAETGERRGEEDES